MYTDEDNMYESQILSKEIHDEFILSDVRQQINAMPNRGLVQLYYKTGEYYNILDTYKLTSDKLDAAINAVIAYRWVHS